MVNQITSLISATTKYTTTEYNTTEDTTTDYDYGYSTKTEYMTAKYDRKEDTTAEYDYDYPTTEKNMTKNDTAIENNNPKGRLIQTVKGNNKVHVTVTRRYLNGPYNYKNASNRILVMCLEYIITTGSKTNYVFDFSYDKIYNNRI